MWRVSANDWRFVLYNPTGFSGSVFYRYCRNFACGSADDAATAGLDASGRFFTPAIFSQNLRDNIRAWEWLGQAPGPTGALPAVGARPGFAAGIDLAEAWQPNAGPFYAPTFAALAGSGANWVTLARRGSLLQRDPRPIYGEEPGQAPLAVELEALVQAAHQAGLRVSLHPVTCAYTPYGACDYWAGAPFGPSFWNDWFVAYSHYLLHQATLARQSGADELVIGDFKLRPALPGEPEAPADADARWRGLIAQVRAVFGGQLAFELLLGETLWPSPPAFLDAVDGVRVWWWAALPGAPGPEWAGAASALLDTQVLPVAQRFGRPVFLSLAYLSVDGAASQCLRRPDGQCYDFRAFDPAAADTATYALDLQEQADLYHAVLTAVNGRPWVMGLSASGYNPVATLRDKSLSVRGKPAEAVLSAWWKLFRQK
jgi:hypothetical protein